MLTDSAATYHSTKATQDTDAIWNIFYHTFIPEKDFKKLHSHADKLVVASRSVAAWNVSPYGKFLAFSSKDSLDQIRHYWLKYSAAKDMDFSEVIEFAWLMKATIAKTLQKFLGPDNMSFSGIRAAGAHFAKAVHTVQSSLTYYCKTGVCAGNERDRILLGKGTGFGNPTFVFSSAANIGYAVHYACNPIDGFHLAEVFDQATPLALATEDAARVAKAQFRLWCDAFLAVVEEGRLHINLHCGDAINFCHMIQRQNIDKTGLKIRLPMFLGPWTATPLMLDEYERNFGQILFDIIDTSNVADHLGLLNLLPATIPLLRRTASSVLYTETLMCPSDNLVGFLDPHLCLDTSTLSVLLGVSPCEFLLGETAYSNATEKMLSQNSRPYYRIQTAWRFPELGDVRLNASRENSMVGGETVYIDPHKLADLFIDFYMTLFADEDVDASHDTSTMTRDFKKLDLEQHMIAPPVHKILYSSFGFAAILHTAMRNIATDWNVCLGRIVDVIQKSEEQSLVSCRVEELILYLHAYGVQIDANFNTHYPLEATHADAVSHFISIRDTLRTNNLGPSVLYLVLVVPRSALQVFESAVDEIGNPGLKLCVIHKPSGKMRTYVSLQCFFGTLKLDANRVLAQEVFEDQSGWGGSSDLIVTCPVLTSSLFLASINEVDVSLAVNNYLSLEPIEGLLGPSLVVWNSALISSERVLLLKATPMSGCSAASTKPLFVAARTSWSETSCVSANISQTAKIDSLCFHDEIPCDSRQSKSLAENEKVVVYQSSPCTMSVRIGKVAPRVLVYPFPVDGRLAKTKLARESSWIEVTVPLSPAGVSGGYILKLFPTLIMGRNPSPWATPRVCIDQQPVFSHDGASEWLPFHIASALTDVEKSILEHHGRDSPGRPRNGTLDFKQTLGLVMTSFAGFNPLSGCRQYKGFGLWVKADACEVVLYVNALRHDRNTASVFLDAWLIQKDFAPSRLPNKAFLPVMISEDESPVWKHILPSVAERCRIGWDHSENCEYRKTGCIPLSVSRGASPLCSCGQGKAVDEFPSDPTMSRLARRATRVALHPIFSVPLHNTSPESSPQQPQASAVSTSSQPQAPAEPKSKCDHCGVEKSGLKACQRCGLVRYCNHACQKAAWKTHKKVCKK